MFLRFAIVVSAVFFLALAGCTRTIHASGPKLGGSDETPATAGNKISVAFVTNNSSVYWADARKGTDAAQSQLPNADLLFVMADTGTVATQTIDVQQLLAKGVQAIAISPVDPKAETPLLNDIAGKVILITQDSDAPNSKRLCYIGTDNHAAGLEAAKLIRQALPSGGKIALFVGNRTAQNAIDRERGIRDGLAGSGISIEAVYTDGTDRALAKSNAVEVLQHHPEVQALVGLWGYNGPAIKTAVQDQRKVGKVKVVCWDSDPATIAGIRNGVIYGTIVQQPYQFAMLSAHYLVRAVQGDMSWIPPSKCLYVPVKTVTKANVDSYAAGS